MTPDERKARAVIAAALDADFRGWHSGIDRIIRLAHQRIAHIALDALADAGLAITAEAAEPDNAPEHP